VPDLGGEFGGGEPIEVWGQGERGRPGLDPAGEPARHPYQVRVIELVVAAAVQPPPTGTETAGVMTDREECVQPDPVHAIIRTGQQVP